MEYQVSYLKNSIWFLSIQLYLISETYSKQYSQLQCLEQDVFPVKYYSQRIAKTEKSLTLRSENVLFMLNVHKNLSGKKEAAAVRKFL